MRCDALGESCLLWRLGDGPSPENTTRVQRVYRRLIDARQNGELDVQDVVPAYDSVALYFDPLSVAPETVRQTAEPLITAAWIDQHQAPDPPEPLVFTVRYDGPDLQRVATHTGLDQTAIIQRHTAPIYTVAAIGFLPHFPYLLGLDPALKTPRLTSPRSRVPAGSVAIGNDQTGVYPQVSPGGWNLLGHTDPNPLQALKPGDRLRFALASGNQTA